MTGIYGFTTTTGHLVNQDDAHWSRYWTQSNPRGLDLVNLTFAPKSDITAYELALIMKDIQGHMISKTEWQSLPVSVTRHFTIND